jgi:alkylation response protein AidB-like acyl-CoA dehydrogenase
VEADSGSALDGGAILANVEEIRPLLREHASEVEAARRLTEPVVDALRSTGVFRMAMPVAWGGPEVDICRQIEIIETLSRADASAGWCAMIGSDSGFYSGYLGSPRLLADGTPEVRIAMLPAAQWQVLNTWSALGMAGSGEPRLRDQRRIRTGREHVGLRPELSVRAALPLARNVRG